MAARQATHRALARLWAPSAGWSRDARHGGVACFSTGLAVWQQESAAGPASPPMQRTTPQESAASASTSGRDEQPRGGLVYTGPFANPHKRLKWASLLNTAASLAASPYIIYASEASPLVRVGLGASIGAFGIFTTAALHWFTSPYVHELRYDPDSQVVSVKGINLFGMERQRSFHIDEVTYPRGFHPLATFLARGKIYYLDRNAFSDAELLRRLTPEDPELVELQRLADAGKAPGRGGAGEQEQ